MIDEPGFQYVSIVFGTKNIDNLHDMNMSINIVVNLIGKTDTITRPSIFITDKPYYRFSSMFCTLLYCIQLI